VLEDNFVILKFDNRPWIDIDRRAGQLDAGKRFGLSFDEVVGKDSRRRWCCGPVQLDVSITPQDGAAGILRGQGHRQNCG
jgi:hypothetical protein